MVTKKKKKKEEFDASLMGWYLPGAHVPVEVIPTLQNPQVVRDLYQWRYTFLKETPLDVLAGEWHDFQRAWFEYALGAGTLQMLAQPPQAWFLTRAGVYPTFRVGLAFEFGGGTMLLATAATLIDPQHKWEGRGLDETAFYKRRVTHGVRKAEWGADSDFRKKAEAKYGWGM